MAERFQVRQAFLPSAGYGTRLRPYTNQCPKPLLPIAGKPMLLHAMDHCLQHGVERFIINTHYRAEAFSSVFPDGLYRGSEVVLVHERELLDTGGGLKNAEAHFAPGPLLVYNPDMITDVSLTDFFSRASQWPQAEAVLAVSSRGAEKRVGVSADGAVGSLREPQPWPGEVHCQYLGICLVRPSFLQRLQARPESLVEGWRRSIAVGGGLVRAVQMDGFTWQDVGSAKAYAAACDKGFME